MKILDFPYITSIEDIEKHIGDHPIARIDRNPGLLTFNYIFATESIFEIDPAYPIGGRMRRECRGITFDSSTGECLSRPFPKFFNIGQKEETLIGNLPWGNSHFRLNKFDGSMIHVLRVGDSLRMLTRGGVSEVSQKAEKFYNTIRTRESDRLLHEIIESGETPILEFESADHAIVLIHDVSRLVLLATRDRATGDISHRFLDNPEKWTAGGVFHIPDRRPDVTDVDAYVAEIRARKDVEGEVIVFGNMMTKIKCDDYVMKHRVCTFDFKGRHLAAAVLDGTVDDIIPMFGEERLKTVTRYIENLDSYIAEAVNIIETLPNIFQGASAETEKMVKAILGVRFGCFKKVALRHIRMQDSDVRTMIIGEMQKWTFTDARFREKMAAAEVEFPTYLF